MEGYGIVKDAIPLHQSLSRALTGNRITAEQILRSAPAGCWASGFRGVGRRAFRVTYELQWIAYARNGAPRAANRTAAGERRFASNREPICNQ